MAPVDSKRRAEIVLRWVHAFNGRDLGAMLSCVQPNVDFHPLPVAGLCSTYRGHEGVRLWFSALQQWRHEHRIGVSRITDTADGETLAVGTLSLPKRPDMTPFCALHRFADGLILGAYHHMSDPDTLLSMGTET